jgi:DNA-directed RNA polymerase subunit RPC12/RpoP
MARVGRPKLADICKINNIDCVAGRIVAGYCRIHYMRVKRTGSPHLQQWIHRCAHCGKEFESPQSKARFCSVLCRDRERQPRRDHAPYVYVDRRRKPEWATCVECGQVYVRNHNNRDYCSQKCARRVAERNRPEKRRQTPVLTAEEKRERKEYRAILRNDPCAYCGAPMAQYDHIDPIARGGSDAWDNQTAACSNCNMEKKATPLLAFLLSRR